MNRNRIVLIAIVLCLLISNSAYALLTGERQAHLYTSNNQMNYEKPIEETVVASKEEKKIQPNTEFTTEEQQTTEQPDKPQDTKKESSESTKKKKNKKKNDKESDKESDKTSDETESGGEEPVPETKQLMSLEYTWTDQNSLLYGKDLNRSTIYVTGVYDNGDRENVAVENCTITGFNSKKLGPGACIISYYGVSVQASYTILNYELSIFCGTWDKRNLYRYGDVFSEADLTVFANMADGTVQQINASDYNVEGVDTKKIGQNSCTIQYKDFVITESYQIHNYAVQLSSTIEKFVVRGDIPWSDIVSRDLVTATMADGSIRNLGIGDYVVEGYSPTTRGGHNVTLKYEDVVLRIPYQVYYDILRVDLGAEQDATQDIFFTENYKVEDISDLHIEEEYISQKNGKTYRLVGVFLDGGYEKPLEYPVTFEVDKEYRINQSWMSWHNHMIYLKYEEVIVEEEDNSENEEDNQENEDNNQENEEEIVE